MKPSSVLTREEPGLETYLDAIATRPNIKRVPSPAISGCLYTTRGSLIRLSQRFGGCLGDTFPSHDPITIDVKEYERTPLLPGRSLYLGHYMSHYGHFLVETLSSFWIFRSFNQYDRIVMHPFSFGTKIPNYVNDIFQAFGIERKQIYIVEDNVRLANVTIPERLIKLNHSGNVRMREVYRYLADAVPSKANSLSGNAGGRLYVSRVKNSLATASRTVINELQIENELKRRGFTVVYPEDLSVSEQVRVFRRADVVCGLSGSALHNCVFMSGDSLLIELGDPRSGEGVHPMQSICQALSEVRTAFIPFRGRIVHTGSQMALIDIGHIVEGVRKALAASNRSQSMMRCTHDSNFFKGAVARIRGQWLAVKSVLRLAKWRTQAVLVSMGRTLLR